MKKRFLYLLLPIVTLVLEILPYGAVCIFASSPTERIRQTFSYFDPLPFGYANFAPLLTAIITCVIMILLIVFWIKGSIPTATAAKRVLYVAIALSLGSLVLGVAYFSLVAGLFTLSLIAELLLLQFTLQKPA
ncbi:MAG: hypothetical protein E7470_08880 [Ruminococcaceae bacterium]|nr:hypothetical protein [Oscillospiraceae bacterium]